MDHLFEDMVELSYYQRFLATLPRTKRSNPPSIWEYQGWRESFPEWTYGKIVPGHSAWSEEFLGFELPMNKYYQ